MIDIEPNVYLMHALGFTADDLEANRTGKLSEAQQKKYKRRENDLVKITTAAVTKYQEIVGKGKRYYYLRFSNAEVLVSLEAYYAFIEHRSYTLYYMGVTLVAAEYADKPLPESYHTACLMDVFQIGPKELDVNRDGLLTASQIKSLQRKNRRWLLPFVAILICVILGGISLSFNDGRWWESVIGRFFVLLPMGLILVAGFFSDRARRGWQEGQVASIRGVVTHRYEDSETILIDGERAFALGVKAAAFCDGQTYTLYYVPYRTFFFDHFNPVVAVEHHLASNPVPEEETPSDANPLITPPPHRL